MISVRRKAFDGFEASSTNESNAMDCDVGINVISSSFAWKFARSSLKNAAEDCRPFGNGVFRIDDMRPSMTGIRKRFVKPG